MQSWGCQWHWAARDPPAHGFMYNCEGLGVPFWQWRGCCAGTPWGPVNISSAPGDSAGAISAPGVPLILLGASSGHHNENSVLIFSHFKLDFKSQVGFKKLIQFFSLRRIDVFPCRLRRDYKICPVRPQTRLEPQLHLLAYTRLVQEPALSFLCRELRERQTVTFSLFFCLSPCTEQDGHHCLSSQEGETRLPLGLGFSCYVPSHHLSSPLLSQAQQTAKDSSSLPTPSNGFSLHLQTTNIWACFCNSKCAIWQNKIHFPRASLQGRGTECDSLWQHGGNPGKGLVLPELSPRLCILQEVGTGEKYSQKQCQEVRDSAAL